MSNIKSPKVSKIPTVLDLDTSQDLASRYEYLRDSPGIIAVKDTNSRHVALTAATAREFFGWRSYEQAIDRTDYCVPCPIMELADQFVNEDKNVLTTGHELTLLCMGQYANGWKAIIAKKSPIYNRERKVRERIVQSSHFRLYKYFTHKWLHLLDRILLKRMKRMLRDD